jgi:hypothetical protein
MSHRLRLIPILVAAFSMVASCTSSNAPPAGGASAPSVVTTHPCDAPTTPQLAPSPPAAKAPKGKVTIAALTKGAQTLSLLSSDNPVRPGPQQFGFDMTNSSNQLLTGGNPTVWLAKDEHARAVGPFVAQWFDFTAYAPCHDRSPRSPLPGVYSARIDVPSAGSWFVAVEPARESGKAVAVGDPGATPPGGITATTTGFVPAAVGSKAVPVRTPVATTEAGLRRICTRIPPDPLHSISLDQALKSGKPTVVVFSTPLLCQSRLCGPVTDEVMLAYQQIGPSKSNFIHVEEFLPGPSLKPPAPTLENQSPGFKAWHLESEPWVVIIDGQGIIRASFDGPVTAPQIESALEPLL